MPNDPFYRSAAWRRYRADVLSRHPFCQVAGCGHLAVVVDHKIRRPIGPDFPSDDGVMALCFQHHNRKTRVHDQRHQSGVYEHRMHGSDASGAPLDSTHPWFK